MSKKVLEMVMHCPHCWETFVLQRADGTFKMLESSSLNFCPVCGGKIRKEEKNHNKLICEHGHVLKINDLEIEEKNGSKHYVGKFQSFPDPRSKRVYCPVCGQRLFIQDKYRRRL